MHFTLSFLLYYQFWLIFTIHSITNEKLKDLGDNVGTVLFTPADNLRKCWTRKDVALLSSRLMFQDLLPDRKVIDISNDHYVHVIIHYFRVILEAVRQEANDEYGKHIMLTALSDTLGGYMHFYLLPITRYAYYRGSVKYDSVEKLYNLFNKFKLFLRTNGDGWVRTDFDWTSVNVYISPYRFKPIQNDATACDKLVFYDGHFNKNDRRNQQGFLIMVPLPFFDSCPNPTAIALPFRSNSIKSVESAASAYILVKYYLAATRCIARSDDHIVAIKLFNQKLSQWLRTYVLVRLNDDRFYAAFGGVLRLLQTLKRCNRGSVPMKLQLYQDAPKVMTVNGLSGVSAVGMTANRSVLDAHNDEIMSSDIDDIVKGASNPFILDQSYSTFLVLSVLVALVIWICLGLAYFCMKKRFRKCKTSNNDSGLHCVCPGPLQSTRPEVTASESSDSQKTKTGCLSTILRKNPCNSVCKDACKKKTKICSDLDSSDGEVFHATRNIRKSEVRATLPKINYPYIAEHMVELRPRPGSFSLNNRADDFSESSFVDGSQDESSQDEEDENEEDLRKSM